MGSLTVKVEIRLTKEDAALLAEVAKARRSNLSQILREALIEWFARRGYVGEEEKKAFGVLLQEAFATNHAQKEK
jgi:uncharacterized protein (DUF1778 family)